MTVVVSILLGCPDPDDTVGSPPASLIGLYEGTYTYREICGVDTNRNSTQAIIMRFTNTSYSIVMDTTVQDTERVFCDVMGEYELIGGCNFMQTDSNLTNMICTPHQNPYGSFGVDLPDSVGDVLRFFQDLADSSGCQIQKEIVVLKIL